MRYLAMAAAAMTMVACAHGQRAYMDPTASMRPESISTWSRPQEFTFTMGDRITGEVSRSCVLGFICWGADDGGPGAIVSGIIGQFTGAATPSDPLVGAAAAGAVFDATAAGNEVDGIYVLNHETDSFNIFVYSRKSARVVGRAVKLKPLGEVSQERADKERFLRAMSHGGSIIQMPAPAL
jgi:hypothetical protein